MADNRASDPSLGEQVRALQDIIDYLDAEQKQQREEQCQLRARLQDLGRLAEIVMQAPGDPRLPPRHARPDRPKLKLIRGGMAALAPLTLLHRRAARVVTAGVLASAVGMTAAAGPTLAPGRPFTAAPPAAVHGHSADRDRREPPKAGGTVYVSRRRRDRDDLLAAVRRDRPERHRGSRRTSSVRKPGPRRDAGRTVTVKHADTRARLTDSGSAWNPSSVMPEWASRRRPEASRPASSRNSARRWSMPSRRANRRCSRSPLAGSAMAASASPRWAARAANCAASPGASGMWPAGLAGWDRRAIVRAVT